MKSLELTIPKPFVFVLMPFDPQFDDVYTFGIKGAAQDVGAYAERVDRQIFQHSVLEQVFNQINKADVIVADMTGQNTNVFYEVGYAHGLGKTVLLLTQDPSDIPFDLQHKQHLVYGGKIEKLRTNLRRNLNWAISESKARSATGAAGRLEVTIDGVEVPDAATMAPAALINKELDGKLFQVYVRLQNNSEAAIPPITHLYLFAAPDSNFAPYSLETQKMTRQVPVTTNTYGAEVGPKFQMTYQPTEVDVEVPVALRAVSLLSDDASVGLSQQFRIKTVVPTIPPWASEEFELGFMLPGGITETESLLQLRIHLQSSYYDFPFRLGVSPTTGGN